MSSFPSLSLNDGLLLLFFFIVRFSLLRFFSFVFTNRGSGCAGRAPVLRYGAVVGDDLAVAGPHQLDRLRSADAGAAGVARGTEPYA